MSLSDIISKVNKEFKTNSITTNIGAVTFENKETIPFPTPSFTYLFHGGFPTKTLWEVSGEFSSGKAQPMYSKVLTINGWKSFSDLRLFDEIYCEDGKLHTVIGIFPQGLCDVYEVTFTDGRSFRCSDEHLFQYTTTKLKSKKSDKSHINTLKEIIELFQENPKRQKQFIFPVNDCMDFSHKNFVVPPYIIGLFLGDGAIGEYTHCPQFVNAEDDLIDAVVGWMEETDNKVTIAQKVGCKCITASKHTRGTKESNAKKLLREAGIWGKCSYEKFIPEPYKFGDKEQRLQLLAGLINTDGYVNESAIKFTSTSKQLCEDVIELARSLGIYAKMIKPDMREKNIHISYCVSILNADILYPYLSIKHKNKYKTSSINNQSCIKTIKYIGKEECQCIYIDNPTHLYITDNYTVTHNTVFCMALAGEAQKYFKKQWEEEVAELQALAKPTKEQKERLAYLINRGHKRILWLDSEHSMYDAEWIAKCGLDASDIIYIKPQEESAEELLQMVIDLIKADVVGLGVVDSLSALSSKSALDKTLMEKTYAGISGALTEWTRQVLSLLNKHDCSVICINQQRDVIGAVFPTTNTPGGRAFKYGCHVRLQFRKEKAIDEDYNEIPNKEETYYGQLSAVQILKNKVTKPDRRLVKFTISFDDGISAVNDIFIMATGLGIIDKAGAWYSILDENGEPKEYNGTLLKFQGKKNFILFMKENPSFAEELKNQVEEAVKQD